nr:limbic system-associated membrane protein-like isoform X1 [Aedes albopictus]XP_029714387.1 limbic system-associated membrane protein-like isoform X1 [Aedes albopictus]XP_029731680.1 limbic system-associated membrane protein-like isoform X1 [Aedes albopictus]XP_029731681.1 limbic system-associated membrane protein-like isoform X1 [Aedes albopictus]
MAGYVCHILLFFLFAQETAYGTSYGNSLSDPLSDPDFIDNPPMIQPKFTSRSQSIRAVIGDTITLPCEVDNLGNNILLWRRGSAVVTASNLIITRDLRFKLLKGYTLQIKNVRPQDAGDYSCQVGDHDNRDLVHTVEILVPPSVRSVPETGHVTVRKGGTATLECKASGNPVPSISWSRKDSLHGAPHLAEGPTLTLESVSRQDSGTYRCFADNGIREPVFVDLQLIVLSPPEITVEKTWVHAGEGYEAQLVCTVHGDSTPEFTHLHNLQMMWYQDSFLLHPNDRRTMDSRGDKHYLTIRNVRQSDFGNYSCVAENTLGRAKKYIEMSGRPGPAQFHSPMYSRYREMYNLTWSVESFPPIEEIRLLYRKLMMNESYQHPGRWHDVILNPPSTRAESYRHIMTYTIRNLDPNSVYETIVQAKNRYGWNEVSDIFQFYTLSSDMPEEDVEQTLGSTAFGNPFGWANRAQSSSCTSWLIVLGILLLQRIIRAL